MRYTKEIMGKLASSNDGVTLVELVISISVFAIVALSLLGLFTALVSSSIVAKRRAVASALVTNQIEYLKSLPYDSLAVSGGSIIAGSYLPATGTQSLNGVTYTKHTSISYMDDAFDGCANYPNQELKEQLCRNYPPPAGAPNPDTNPADYKVVSVYVGDKATNTLARASTQIAARVSETASTTGALFVSVLDETGNPVSSANVNLVNNTLTPNVNISDSSDNGGIAIFYGLPPDISAFDYTITASKADYSTLTTIIPNGTLQPTYPSQKIITQLSSFVTLTIKKQGVNSLVLESTNTFGGPLSNVKIALKGGYKKYTLITDSKYYYDNFSPSDARVTTDGTGLAAVSNLTPGDYFACGDSGSTGCSINGTPYYLIAAVPYGGVDTLQPITVPTFDSTKPPATTFSFNSLAYLQKVRLMFSNSGSYLRLSTVTPGEASKTDDLTNFAFTITGVNLPCSSVPASCATSVILKQGVNDFIATCTGASGVLLNCNVNLSTATTGMTQLQVSAGGNTLLLPGSPLVGGINVVP